MAVAWVWRESADEERDRVQSTAARWRRSADELNRLAGTQRTDEARVLRQRAQLLLFAAYEVQRYYEQHHGTRVA